MKTQNDKAANQAVTNETFILNDNTAYPANFCFPDEKESRDELKDIGDFDERVIIGSSAALTSIGEIALAEPDLERNRLLSDELNMKKI